MFNPGLHWRIFGNFLLLADVFERLRRQRIKIIYFQMQFHTLHGKSPRLYQPGREKVDKYDSVSTAMCISAFFIKTPTKPHCKSEDKHILM